MTDEKNIITDEYGNEYNSMQDYYNSPYLDDDIIYNYLAYGKRQPQNEIEERWAKEGKLLLDKGGYDIYFN